MKKQTKIFTAILAMGILFSASCKKKEDDSVKAKLTGKWKMTQIGADDNYNDVMEATEVGPVDDSLNTSYTFNGDGTGSAMLDLGGGNFSVDFSWKLLNNDQDIQLSVLTETFVSHIQSITSSELVIKDTSTVSGTLETTWSVMAKQ